MRVYLVECSANIDRCARLCDAFGVPLTYVRCGSLPSMTAQRRLMVDWSLADECPTDETSLALTPHDDAPVIGDVQWSSVGALLLGNEQRGLPEDVLCSCQTARIPMQGGWSSLTIEVALAIALWEWRHAV